MIRETDSFLDPEDDFYITDEGIIRRKKYCECGCGEEVKGKSKYILNHHLNIRKRENLIRICSNPRQSNDCLIEIPYTNYASMCSAQIRSKGMCKIGSNWI